MPLVNDIQQLIEVHRQRAEDMVKILKQIDKDDKESQRLNDWDSFELDLKILKLEVQQLIEATVNAKVQE